jgi:hypothetical protein
MKSIASAIKARSGPTGSRSGNTKFRNGTKGREVGVFIHWGVYSVPAFGSEWYPRDMHREGSEEYKPHIATYGPQDKFG